MTIHPVSILRAAGCALLLWGLPVFATTVELTAGEETESCVSTSASTLQDFGSLLCIQDVISRYLIISGGPRNTTVTAIVGTSPTGNLRLSTSQTGPFVDGPITFPIRLDSTGYGTSDRFYLRGDAAGTTTLNFCYWHNNVMTCNSANFTVLRVASLVFTAMDSPLDTNPNTGGGLRMYPEKQTASDIVDRKKVQVVATLEPAVPNVTLYFRSFDLDDPSSDTAPVDANGALGDDNRGSDICGTLQGATACNATTTTDASGIARLEFTTTAQPGDNFRIAASCNQTYIGGVTVQGTDLEDTSGATLPTDQAAQTDMLTVWRRVHIENESMGPVSGNRISGTVRRVRYDAATNQSTLSLGEALGEVNRFQGGRLEITGYLTFALTGSERRAVTLTGDHRAAQGLGFFLADDDDFNGDDGALLDGDEGEDVTQADTGLIEDSDSATDNVFAAAYVRPVYDVGDGDQSVSFVLNSNTTRGGNALIADYDFDASATEADDEFWTVYLLGGYQPDDPADGDPADPATGTTLGIVDDLNGQGATVFNESFNEVTIKTEVNNQVTTAHEIGHLFNGAHADLGLMEQSSTRTSIQFSDVTLNTIRSLAHP